MHLFEWGRDVHENNCGIILDFNFFFSEVYEYTIEQCSPQMTRYENLDKLHHFCPYNFCINKFGLLTYKVTVIHRFLKSLCNTIIVLQ